MWFSKQRTGCEHTLILHADGTNECEGHDRCGSDELLHDWSAPCHELGCACTGEEHDLGMPWLQAA